MKAGITHIVCKIQKTTVAAFCLKEKNRLLEESVQQPKPEVQNCLEKIGESSEHLLTFINDVLDISLIESGKTEFDPQSP